MNIMETIMTAAKVDGGVVKTAIMIPDDVQDQLAISAVWSSSRWIDQNRLTVRQFRRGVFFAEWPIATVQFIRRQDAVLVLPLDNPYQLYPLKGDVLIFGDGAYTTLAVERTDLPIDVDSAIEVGRCRYPGVALTEHGIVRQVIFFHSAETTIEWESSPFIWWQGRSFAVNHMHEAEPVV